MGDVDPAAQRPVLSEAEQSAEDAVPAGDYPLSRAVGGTVHVPAFRMDRYPVTVARYAAFVDDGGYDDDELWDDDGWDWRLREAIGAPRWWDVREPHWSQFLTPDRPIIGVSWYEARAFCRFSARRLPSEREWEAAARGTDGRLYPWGHGWERGRVGNRDVGPRLTWPVGTFAGARGPFGHLDLVANVWQWTSDAWSDDKPHLVAVRGGAWSSRDEHCRADHRNAYGRDGRWSHVGFRTVAGALPPR